jgi:Glycosyltransferase family 87
MTSSLAQRVRQRDPHVYRLAWLGLLGLMALVAVSHFVWVTVHHVQWLSEPGVERSEVPDWVAFYSAGQLVLDGNADQIYNLDSIAAKEREVTGSPFEDKLTLPYFNPPFFAVLIAPLTRLPLAGFAAVLFTINLVLFIGCGIALQRLIGLTKREHLVFFWLAYGATMPVFNIYLQHQLTLFVVAGWLGFVWMQLKGREGLSGAMLTLGLVKPPLIALAVLYLLYQRQWRALGSFSAIAGALTLASVAVAGPQILVDYPRFLIDSTRWVDTNGLRPYFLFGLNGLLIDLLKDQTPPQWLLWPLTLGTLALVLSTWRGSRNAADGRLLPLMAVAVVGSVMMDQHLYLHDMLLVSLAIGFATAHTVRTTGGVGRWGAIAIVMWLFHLPVLIFAYDRGFPLFMLSTVALFYVLLRDAWQLNAATLEGETPVSADMRVAA